MLESLENTLARLAFFGTLWHTTDIRESFVKIKSINR